MLYFLLRHGFYTYAVPRTVLSFFRQNKQLEANDMGHCKSAENASYDYYFRSAVSVGKKK